MARKRVAKPADNTKTVKESGRVPLIPPRDVTDLLYKGLTFNFALDRLPPGGLLPDVLPTAALVDVVEKQLADHRTVEELIAKVANRLVCQHDYWTLLGTDPPDLLVIVEYLTAMLHEAPHGFGRRDLEWLVDVADDQEVRYNVLGFMRFMDLGTGELNIDAGTGFVPQYVR